jgi:hypothetical protein
MSLTFTARMAACWLIALVIFPFSAPLSVCDLGDLVPKPMAGERAPLSKSPVRTSVVKDALAQAFPIRASRTVARRDGPSGRSASVISLAIDTTIANCLSSSSSVRLSRPVTKTILRI